MALSGESIPTDWVAITPSNTVDHHLVGFLVTAEGTVTALTSRGNSVAFGTLPVGLIVPGLFQRIMAIGTTATVIGARP